jgi:hypothetical protein
VEKEPIVIDNIYAAVKQEYLFSSKTSEEIRVSHGLSNCDWRDIIHRIQKEEGINRRPTPHAKYYYKQGNGFNIQKKINGKIYHFGKVATETLAQKVVELCKECNWDIQECYNIVRRCNNEGIHY